MGMNMKCHLIKEPPSSGTLKNEEIKISYCVCTGAAQD